MKKFFTFIFILSAFASATLHAETEAMPISKVEKALICQSIETHYGTEMLKDLNLPKWVSCREKGRFRLRQGIYEVILTGESGELVCQGSIGHTFFRRPVVTGLDCIIRPVSQQ